MDATTMTQPATLTAASWESNRRGWRSAQVARYLGQATLSEVIQHFVATHFHVAREVIRISDSAFALEPERRGRLVLKEAPHIYTAEGDSEAGWDIWRTRLD
jgi:hypothetical protein